MILTLFSCKFGDFHPWLRTSFLVRISRAQWSLFKRFAVKFWRLKAKIVGKFRGVFFVIFKQKTGFVFQVKGTSKEKSSAILLKNYHFLMGILSSSNVGLSLSCPLLYLFLKEFSGYAWEVFLLFFYCFSFFHFFGRFPILCAKIKKYTFPMRLFSTFRKHSLFPIFRFWGDLMHFWPILSRFSDFFDTGFGQITE